jgi:hypothetical protein
MKIHFLILDPMSNKTIVPMTKVIGIEMTQKRLCVLDRLRMSSTFMPRYPVTNDSGRKMTVTTVKIRIAFSLDSVRIDID